MILLLRPHNMNGPEGSKGSARETPKRVWGDCQGGTCLHRHPRPLFSAARGSFSARVIFDTRAGYTRAVECCANYNLLG